MGDKIRIKDAFDGDNYEPTDSDEYYSEEEQELLKEVRAGRKRDVEPTKELMAFDESDDDDDEDEDDDVGALLRDSDIEGAEDSDGDLPDPMDWGNKARNYYNTDFVDPDYDAYTAEEEAMALEEEAEAMRIQKRLLKQMTERDFIPEYMDIKPANEKKADPTEPAETIVIKADLSGLSANDKLKLLEEDSPEFLRLTNDFEVHMKEVNTLVSPVLQYVRKHNVPMIPALQFAKLYQDISLTYCNNIAFYLVLKAKRIPIRTHPVIQRLLQLKKLLQQLEDKYENIIHPQLEALLERIVDGDQFEVLDVKRKAEKAKKKSKLSILDQFDAEGKIDAAGDNDAAASDAVASSDDSDEDGEVEDEDEAAEQAAEDARRGITYQIAKNKGLTPHRKKELRNPRVKHRSKFRKALIRRKGAVRTVRKETKRYGGEISGIKATVSKSIKFKV